jgi:hypothetical protein
MGSRDGSIGIGTGCGLGGRGSIPCRRKIFLIFSTMFRPALRPSHLPMQWLPNAVYQGLKRPERETHLKLVPMLRMVELYLHSSVRLQGQRYRYLYSRQWAMPNTIFVYLENHYRKLIANHHNFLQFLLGVKGQTNSIRMVIIAEIDSEVHPTFHIGTVDPFPGVKLTLFHLG